MSPSVVEAVQQQENDMTRARSMAALSSSSSSSHHRQSPQRRPNSGGGGGGRRNKSPSAAIASSSSRHRQYRSEMNLDKKTESSRAQIRGTRRRLSSSGQGDNNSSFYFSEGTVLDEVDHMLSSSDSELNN